MKEVEITEEMVKKQSRGVPNWKAPGRDSMQQYWLKNLTSLHPCKAKQVNDILNVKCPLAYWMTSEKTALCQKIDS